MLEVETKFLLDDRQRLIEALGRIGAIQGKHERHADTYFRHPCRDFVQTKEALRIRSIDSVASVTYKGPKLAVADSALKARKEIEWCLAPGDADGNQMEQLLLALGFTPVATVRKERLSFNWPSDHANYSQFTLTIDQVEQVGRFAEIEVLIDDESPDVETAGKQINELAGKLGLSQAVPNSYLRLLLNKIGE